MAVLTKLESRPVSLGQLVYGKIRQAIIDETLPPGSKISETGLARHLEVSKTPVREAILRLSELGLIEGDGKDQRVIRPSELLISESYEARLALEGSTISLAAQRSSESEQADLLELAHETVSACDKEDPVEFRRYDALLHQQIADCSGNQLLARLTRDAIDRTSVLRMRDAPMSAVSMRCAHEHVRMAELIKEGNSEEARTLIGDHILAVQQRVLADFNQSKRNGKAPQ